MAVDRMVDDIHIFSFLLHSISGVDMDLCSSSLYCVQDQAPKLAMWCVFDPHTVSSPGLNTIAYEATKGVNMILPTDESPSLIGNCWRRELMLWISLVDLRGVSSPSYPSHHTLHTA